MAEIKTKENDASVETFLDGIEDEQRRKDCQAVAKLMQQATKAKPKMWGSAIIGFGSYHYKYASGREGDWMLIGFSPRKQNLTLYIGTSFEGYEALLKKLGKHKTGVGCLYINKLSEVDLAVLKQLIQKSVEQKKQPNP